MAIAATSIVVSSNKTECYQQLTIIASYACTRIKATKHLLASCEAKCLTEQRKHKNNLFFIAIPIIHGENWMIGTHVLVFFFSSLFSFCCCSKVLPWCVLSLCAICVSVAVSRPHHFSLSETNREILWNVRTSVHRLLYVFSLSFSPSRALFFYFIFYICSLNTVNNSAFVRHFIRNRTIHPLKYVFFILYIV